MKMSDAVTSKSESGLISVTMPLFNGEQYIREAIESILSQTYENFELLVGDDCSTDNSLEIVEALAKSDPRIRVIRNTTNKGIAANINALMKNTKGEYIARMDADDICTPDRLEKQYQYMREHRLDVCGCWIRYKDNFPTKVKYPVTDSEIRLYMFFRPPFANPAVMFRKEAISGITYRHDPYIPEDYEFWTRLPNKLRLGNVPRVLLHYRQHLAQNSATKDKARQKRTHPVRENYLRSHFAGVSQAQVETHLKLRSGNTLDITEFDEVRNWLEIIASNYSHNEGCLNILRNEWFFAITNAKFHNPKLWKTYTSSGLLKYQGQSRTKKISLWLSCMSRIPYPITSRHSG